MSSHKSPSLNASMSISKGGKSAISKDEGFRSHPYDDQNHLCTVGTGLKISNKPCTPAQKATAYDPDELSATFHTRLHEAERYVRHYVRASKLTQGQYDSLTSFVFNVGVGNAHQVLNLADGGDTAKVADEMSKYVNVTVKDKKGKVHHERSNGLLHRRAREVKPFQPAPPPAAPSPAPTAVVRTPLA